MEQKEVTILARLGALDFLVTNLLANDYLKYPNPVETATRQREEFLAYIQNVTAPNIDPAASDLLVSELQAAIDNILQQVIGIVEEKARGPSSTQS